ncbi:MAG TPA: sugar ABC transporter permease, partial [Actinomycetes bacterium]|nr:sugar ABC transporter permease [Actinomycetes bacterium]
FGARPTGGALRPSSRWTPYLLVGPAVAFFGFVVGLPMLGTIWLSFNSWSGTNDIEFIGFDNFTRAFHDTVYRTTYVNTLIYIAATLVLEVAVGFALAGLVSVKGKRTAWYRVTFFIPVMLPMVVIAVLWSFIYSNDGGLLNSFLTAIGQEDLTHVWLGDPNTALLSISVVSGWIYAGFYMAIFYAALQRVPASLQEAARLDGVSEWGLFFKIKVPLVRGMTEVAALLCITGAFQSFDLFYVMTNGGPDHSTEIVTTYLVSIVFRDHEVGYGAALSVIMTVVVVGIGLIYAKLRSGDGVDIEY